MESNQQVIRPVPPQVGAPARAKAAIPTPGSRTIRKLTGRQNRFSTPTWGEVGLSQSDPKASAKDSCESDLQSNPLHPMLRLPGDWASSFLTQPAADESAAVFAPPPASAPARRGLPLTPGEHVLRGDVADGTVQ